MKVRGCIALQIFAKNKRNTRLLRFADKCLKIFVPRKKRHVVYTCLFGRSEWFWNKKLPRDGRTDFIVFTDDKALKSRHWKAVYIDSRELGPVRTASMIKIKAHKYVGTYAKSLYIDNTVKLLLSPGKIFSLLNAASSPMLCLRHPWWQCVYVEVDHLANIMECSGRDQLIKQTDCYRKSGYPENAGMIAGHMLLRRHDDDKLNAVMEAWFEEVKKHSCPDHTSFNYTAWKENFCPTFFDDNLINSKLTAWPLVRRDRMPYHFDDKDKSA